MRLRTESRDSDRTGASGGARRARRSESGATLVEFALVAPVLFLILFGIIDFGSVFGNYEQLRQGTQEAGRQAAVNNFGTNSTCALSFAAGTPTAIKEIMCTAYGQIPDVNTGASTSTSVEVRVSGSGSGYVQGNSVEVCTAVPLSSLSGMLKPILSGRWMTSSAIFYIENTYSGGDGPSANGSWAAGPYGSFASSCT